MSAVQATVSKFMSLADGTLRLQLDIHQTDSKVALELLCEVGQSVAIAALTDGIGVVPLASETSIKEDYAENECDNSGGKLMQALYRSGWFHAPKVLEALGSDRDFLFWCERQPCWCCDQGDDDRNAVVAAHYRKVSEGAGTGIKPPYSAIPLCSRCHHKQHQHGYSVLGTNDWWEAKVAQARQEWGHQQMRKLFETESLSAIPAKWIVEWALEHELNALIPQEYLT